MITYLCVKQPVRGNLEGICVVCGVETKEGHKNTFSEKFTAYSFLTHGNCMCPHCFTFFKDQSFRKKSWITTEKEVKFLKRLECEQYIFNPPSPPFAFYITQSGQRQGWLSGMRFVNYSNNQFYILTDFVGCILVQRKEVEEMHKLIRLLREKGISKTQLRSGEFNMHIYKKAIEGNYHNAIESIKNHIKKPLWEVMLYVAE